MGKYRITFSRVDSNPSDATIDEHRGMIFRSIEGVELRTGYHVVDGLEQPGTGRLIDRPNGAVYHLSYENRYAYSSRKQEPILSPEPAPKTTVSRPERVINGVRCVEMPIKEIRLGARKQQIGETVVVGTACYSNELGIFLSKERTQQSKDGPVRVVEDVYDLQVGASPRPDEIQIPSDFAVYDDAAEVPAELATGCQNCPGQAVHHH